MDILTKLDQKEYFTYRVDPKFTFYYSLIKNPIFLITMKEKARTNYYNENTVSKLTADLNLLFKNIKTYNMPNSPEYMEGLKLELLAFWTLRFYAPILEKKVEDYLSN